MNTFSRGGNCVSCFCFCFFVCLFLVFDCFCFCFSICFCCLFLLLLLYFFFFFFFLLFVVVFLVFFLLFLREISFLWKVRKYFLRRHVLLLPFWKRVCIITKTCLYNIDPLKPNFYVVKLGFTWVYIIFLISAQKHRLWVLVRTALFRRDKDNLYRVATLKNVSFNLFELLFLFGC